MKPRLLSFLLLIQIAGCASLPPYGDVRRLYGDPAPPGVGRLIVIHPDTRYVNVEGGETIHFQADGREFGWHFNVARSVQSFELHDIAPAGMLHGPVRVYVRPDPRYRGLR